MKNCEWCLKEFEKVKSRFCSIVCRNRYTSSKNDYKIIGEKVSKALCKRMQIVCTNCNTLFQQKEKKSKFCSRNCSIRFLNKNRTKESREKQSKIMKEKFASGAIVLFRGTSIRTAEKTIKNCLTCSAAMVLNPSQLKRKYCKKECVPRYLRSKEMKDTLSSYRKACSFKFNLAKYPEEFDFDLIKKYGFYSPKNKKNNLGGVSRDHMFSIREGYDKKILPEIMKHPANCKLMIHNENVSKFSKSSISEEELLKRIKVWNEKYSAK